MGTDLESMRASLRAVEVHRLRRSQDTALGSATHALKAFQRARLALTHADALVDARWSQATRFFLDELYGPADFSARDRDFARVLPALVRLFPHEVVQTVAGLLALHALSEDLDTAMAARALVLRREGQGPAAWSGALYEQAWREVGRRVDREAQLRAVMQLGEALDRLNRLPGLGRSLHLMRMPARLAGLSTLQGFLERGHAAFDSMGGHVGAFLDQLREREAAWLEWWFEPARRAVVRPTWLGAYPGEPIGGVAERG